MLQGDLQSLKSCIPKCVMPLDVSTDIMVGFLLLLFPGDL